MHEAAEQLGRSGAAREEVERLGRLAIAAAKDETEAPALRAAASAAVTGEFGAQITLLIHQEKLDARRVEVRTAPRTVRRCGAH